MPNKLEISKTFDKSHNYGPFLNNQANLLKSHLFKEIRKAKDEPIQAYKSYPFLADRTIGRAIGTACRLSSVVCL